MLKTTKPKRKVLRSDKEILPLHCQQNIFHSSNWIVPLSSACLVQVGQDGVETWENVTCSPLSMIHCNNKVERSAALAPLSALPPPGFSFMWNHFVDQRQENLQLLQDWSHPPHDACSVPPCMARCRWQQYFYISLQKEFVPC